jgi:hypothetical protein
LINKIKLLTATAVLLLLSGCDDGKVEDCTYFATNGLEFYVHQSIHEAVYKAGTKNYPNRRPWKELFENDTIKPEYAEHLQTAISRNYTTLREVCSHSLMNICRKSNIESYIEKDCRRKVANMKGRYKSGN